MRIANEALITAPVDIANPWASDAIYLGHISNYSIQLFFSGAPVGRFYLQSSNDAGNPTSSSHQQQIVNVVNWTTISGSTQIVDAAGDHTWQVQNAGYAYVRVVWAPTSGTGSIDSARYNLKGV
jgi:hypothetical protein